MKFNVYIFYIDLVKHGVLTLVDEIGVLYTEMTAVIIIHNIIILPGRSIHGPLQNISHTATTVLYPTALDGTLKSKI